MKTGLIVYNLRTHGYFSKHWKDELAARGFDSFYADPHDREANFQQVRRLLSQQEYRYLFITAGTIPLEFGHLERLNGVAKILFLTDDDWQFYPFSRFYGLAFEWIITTYQDNIALYRSHGFEQVIHSQWGFNQRLFRPLEVPKTLDVSLIGNPHGDRVEMINYLLDHGVQVRLYGSGWNKIPNCKKHWQGYLSDEKMVEVINRTMINLNPARSGDRATVQIKGRTFELAGCGAFQLTERNDRLFDFFERDKEIVTYESYSDLKEKISYFLKREREREEIAAAAHHRALRDHTWQKRLDQIFAEIEQRTMISPISKRLPAKNPKVNVIYQTHGNPTLSPGTLASIGNQDYDNFNVYLISGSELPCLKGQNCVKFNDPKEAIDHLDGKYVAFIADGDIWAPEKLKFQVFALENDSETTTGVSLTNFGLYFHEPENEIIHYNFANKQWDNGMDGRCPCIVLSSVTVNTEMVRRFTGEFTQFIDIGIMTGRLQRKIVPQTGRVRYIDMQYSACSMPFKSFRGSVKAYYRAWNDPQPFFNCWSWRRSKDQLIRKTLFSYPMMGGIAAFMVSMALKKSISLHWLYRIMPV